MKIHLLPLGARFEYEGEEYVKSGPMIGSGKNGQRLIPKYAVLKPLGDGAGAAAPSATAPASAAVMQAFDTFYEKCQALVGEDRQAELAAARAAFLAALR
ncbi:hypothetical protein [Rhodocyclus tenuis]|uniref:Uncharacterized protein n=1 Tax=Rhodocyclus tenuis TaxID=1066 RepID=A0A840G7E3_RHOTE|nr:hypothetical protein [Rhodocyclus tenuis]MBB4247805.1 hypothetical protein [Rhodocyclus tenuis]MBK1681076.1 hypothetical protein [Rhodocyclus tenuis]